MKKKKTIYFILMYLPIVVTLIALNYLPDRIPAHYGSDDQVTRYGSKYESLLYPIVTVFMGYFLLAMAKLAARQEEHGEDNRKVILATGIFVLLQFNVLNGYYIYTAVNRVENLSSVPLSQSQLVFGVLGLLMIVVGNIMPKTKMNSIVGVRTYWSRKNEVTWKKSQRMGGITFIAGGVIVIGICIALKGTPCLLAVLGVLTVLIVIDIYLTYRIAKRN